MSGLDLAAITRERHPAAQAVLISGTAPGLGRLRYREHLLRESFAPGVLAETVRGAERRSQKLHAPGRPDAPTALARGAVRRASWNGPVGDGRDAGRPRVSRRRPAARRHPRPRA